MNPDEFKKRRKMFALRIIRLVESLSNTKTASVVGRQLLRSGTLAGANYRAACRSRSRAEFISKTGIMEEEGDESLCWTELLVASREMAASRMSELMKEVSELPASVVACCRTARSRGNSQSAIRNPKSN